MFSPCQWLFSNRTCCCPMTLPLLSHFVFVQSGVCWHSAEDSRVNEQTETRSEGHGDQLLQDVTSMHICSFYHLPHKVHLGFCFTLYVLLSVLVPGSESSDSSVSGPDVPPQRSCTYRPLFVVWSYSPPRLPHTAVSQELVLADTHMRDELVISDAPPKVFAFIYVKNTASRSLMLHS